MILIKNSFINILFLLNYIDKNTDKLNFYLILSILLHILIIKLQMYIIGGIMENIDITTSSLKFIYDGEDLKNHEMDAMELALIIESLNDLFLEVNSELNFDFTTIKLRVKANFEKGSFGIEFIVEVLKNIELLLNSSPTTATLTAIEIINILRNILSFIKMTKGKISENNDSSIEIEEDGSIYVKNIDDSYIKYEYVENTDTTEIKDGNTITTKTKSQKMVKLCYNGAVRKNVEKITSPIKRNNKIDKLKIEYSNGEIQDVADKSNIDFYKAPDIILNSKNRKYRKEVVLCIDKLSFNENNKWTLYNVDMPKISVLIEDKKFLNNVKYNKEYFSKDDELRVILRIEEFYKNDKRITEYFVEEVLEHIKAVETPYIPFVD